MVEGDPSVCGHVISTTASGGSNRQSINYSTERVVGNGSFGVVFQATCLETGETVSAFQSLHVYLNSETSSPHWKVKLRNVWGQKKVRFYAVETVSASDSLF